MTIVSLVYPPTGFPSGFLFSLIIVMGFPSPMSVGSSSPMDARSLLYVGLITLCNSLSISFSFWVESRSSTSKNKFFLFFLTVSSLLVKVDSYLMASSCSVFVALTILLRSRISLFLSDPTPCPSLSVAIL